MKSIKITGKRNTDKVNNIVKPQRKDTLNWNFDEIYFTYNKQIEISFSMKQSSLIEEH